MTSSWRTAATRRGRCGQPAHRRGHAHAGRQRQPAGRIDAGRTGKPDALPADNGNFSQGSVKACEGRILALIAPGRDAHHLPLEERLAVDAPEPNSDDPVVNMARALKTRQGRAQYGKPKCTVEPVFGVIKQMMGFRQLSFRGLQATSGE
jgi:hypothetical protein